MLRSRATEGRVLVSVTLFFCWTFVCLRVYVRTIMVKCFGMDDWLLLAALVTFTAYCSAGLAAISHGVGQDTSLIPNSELPWAICFWWLATILYNPTTLFVRLSISVFIHKLCVLRMHKIIIWSTMAVCIAFSIFYFVLTIVQCSPTSYFWKKYSGATGHCIDERIFPGATYAHSAISAMADWVLGLLPIWLIWDLQMGKRTKISVAVLLGLGMLAGVAAIIRIPYVRVLGDDKKQFLYKIVDVSIWSLIEAALGLIAASASALRPLFRKFYELSTSHTRSHSHALKDYSRSKSTAHNGYLQELGSTSNTTKGSRSRARDRDGMKENGGTFFKDDDSSLELGLAAGRSDANVLAMTGQGSVASRNGSEENLTGNSGGKGDIHVRTVIEVNSGN